MVEFNYFQALLIHHRLQQPAAVRIGNAGDALSVSLCGMIVLFMIVMKVIIIFIIIIKVAIFS